METICVCRGHEGLYQQARLNLKVGYFLGKYKLGQGGGGWGGRAQQCVYCIYRSTAYYYIGLYYSFHSLHKFISIFCNGLYYSLHTRQGLTLIPFGHNVRGDPVELGRYSINTAIAGNQYPAKNAKLVLKSVRGWSAISRLEFEV